MWHEARRSERAIHGLMDAAKKRAERRAEFLAQRKGDPNQTLRIVGGRARLHHNLEQYQAAEAQQGLIPWNGKPDNLIDRFDGRAMLDFIREYDAARFPPREKTEEEEELDELCQFERYRDLIKYRRRGLTDEEGLEDVEQKLEDKATAPVPVSEGKAGAAAAKTVPPGTGEYAKVGFAYNSSKAVGPGAGASGSDDDSGTEGGSEEEEESSEDSEDEEVERIGREFGVESFNRLVYLDRRAKEEEKKAKEAALGDASLRKLNRKERRKLLAQQEKIRDRPVPGVAAARSAAHRSSRSSPTYDPYPKPRQAARSRSRSRSRSPRRSRGSGRDRPRERDRARERERDGERHGDRENGRVQYITHFSVGKSEDDPAPRSAGGGEATPSGRALNEARILEALRGDPAMAWPPKVEAPAETKREATTAAAIGRLSKPAAPLAAKPGGGPLNKAVAPAEKKETPQERLMRIMSKQLNKQIRKDSEAELTKKREQERTRQEKLAETRRAAYSSRSYSHSPPPRSRYSRSRSRSPPYRDSRRDRSRSPPRRR